MASTHPVDPVRAAGVVLLRAGKRGTETALIHRPHRADWSLPKGKVDPGEHILTAAVRECDEETGLVPRLGPPLMNQTYQALGRDKIVDYWRAEIAEDEGFAPDDEVDEVRWVAVEDAPGMLTYPRDADVVRQAVALPPTSPLILLRHTQALKRSDFAGADDTQRPLSGKGRSQAKAIVPLLSAYGIDRVYSSDSVRCSETVRRFAKSIGAPIHAEPTLSEVGHAEHPKRAAKRMRELLADPARVVVCSHRPVLPTLVEAIAGLRWSGRGDLDEKLPPGGFLVVHRHFDGADLPRIVAVERHTL
jgi:phosphohistidine phosphatase SixA/8-oxo-dGTP pyrophosphatase MutT (NUDIX family)